MMSKEIHMKTAIRLGYLAVAVGIILGVDQYFSIGLYRLWPLLLCVMGYSFGKFFLLHYKRNPLFLILSLIFIQLGALFLYSSFAGWHTMGTLWPAFIGIIGTTTLAHSFHSEHRKRFVFLGLINLSLMLVFFFVFSLSSSLWWTMLILLGVTLLLSANVE